MKSVLSGNEAIARGAFEAGVKVAAAYPGTPSTEILENIIQYDNIYAEWAPNEKVALEVCTGAAIAGSRTLACMKHVGVNVAADPLFTAAYTGIKGGLVIITADDPAMHSSQNEQDNRNYAKFAKIPMLEPSDSQEAKDFVKIAFEISEKFDTPVFIRTTTRISHAKSIVKLEDPMDQNPVTAPEKQPGKYVMLPGNARARHPLVEERIKQLSGFNDRFEKTEMEINDTAIGIIAGGICYTYAKESFPEASFLKLGMVYPLPEAKIREFADKVDKIYVFEELDPFLEEQIKAMGIPVTGKAVFPVCGEFDPMTAETGITGTTPAADEKPLIDYLPPRPPNMCPGCPHRGIFYTLSKLKLFVTGDIGCYTLGALPPLQAMDTCICMGGSIGHAMGIDKALGRENLGKTVAVIGDSTFLHSGITGLLDIVYNRGSATVMILDNRITAMTGRQENPASGRTLRGEETKSVDFTELSRALGVDHVVTINPYDLSEVETVIREEINRPEPSVIISSAPCVLHRTKKKEKTEPLRVAEEKCIGCRVCLNIGCPAIEWKPERGKKGQPFINPGLCNGCRVCQQVCKTEAIVKSES